jgi:hypothetical protein
MFTTEEIELGKAALEIAYATDGAHHRVVAMQMLRDECGWTLRRADQVLSHLLAMPELAKAGA